MSLSLSTLETAIETIEKENTVRASLLRGVSLEEVYKEVGAI